MKKVLFMAAFAAALFACSKEQGDVWNGAMPVSVDPTITRATEVDFEQGDQIGLTIVTAENEQVALNSAFTFNGETFTSNAGLLWYEDLGLASTLTAYYPYVDGSENPATFAIAADQRAEGYFASDLMMATKAEVKPSVQAVDMTFYHKMTKIVINVTNDYGMTVKGVTLYNVVPQATVDVASQQVEVAEGVDAVSVQAREVESGKKYAAIIVPQTVALKVEVEVESNGTSEIHTQRLAEAQLASGGQYSMAITVLPSEVDVVLSGDIADWDDQGSLTVGEVPFEEYDTYFVYDGETYNFKTLADGNTWMVENLRFVPDGKQVSSDPAEETGIWYPYTSDGTTQTAVTDSESVKNFGLLYNAETAFGKKITVENAATFEGAQGICPKGWHIPTYDDILNLVGKGSKLSATTGEIPQNTEAAYYDSEYDGARITTMNNDGFNFVYAGTRNATGTYIKPVSGFAERPMTYMWGSTLYQTTTNDDGSIKNVQYLNFGSTNTSVYSDGRLTMMFGGYKFGVVLRCVRDEAK